METNRQKEKSKVAKSGLSFVEILIAIMIISGCAVPIVYMLTSSRTDTSKAINYLRAMELANEAIEWATVTPFEKLTDETFSAFWGSLVTDGGAGLAPDEVAVVAPDHPVWSSDGVMAKKLSYSEQYNKAFFFREIEIEDVSAAYLGKNMMKKVSVTIKWCEGKMPGNINNGDDRTRQVQLSVLIGNDANLYF